MSKSDGRPQGAGLKMGAPTRPEVDPTAGLGTGMPSAGMSRVETEYQQAVVVHVPRKLDKVREMVLDEAARMGEAFVYSWRQKDQESRAADGKSTIEGLSIDGAMILYRNWGNCALPTEIVDETPTHWIFKATFIDLERGITYPRMFRQRKASVVGGGMGAERKMDAAFSIGISKCQRNTINGALPSWLRDEAIETAKNSAAKKYAKVAEHVPAVLAYAKSLGVHVDQLERHRGRPVGEWGPHDILALRLAFKTIHDKEASVEEEFPPLVDDAGTVTAAQPAGESQAPSSPSPGTVRHLESTSEGPAMVDCSKADCQDPTHAGGTVGDSAAYLDAQKAVRTASAATETKGAVGEEAPPPSSKPKPPQGEAPAPPATPPAPAPATPAQDPFTPPPPKKAAK